MYHIVFTAVWLSSGSDFSISPNTFALAGLDAGRIDATFPADFTSGSPDLSRI